MATTFDLSGRQAWATNFYFREWSEHAREAPGILEHIERLRAGRASGIASGVAPGAKSRYGLCESPFDLFREDHPGLKSLVAFIAETLRQAISHVNGGKVDPRRIVVEFVDSWFHVTNDGGFHDAHYHHDCSWCGIYYVQAGDVGPTSEPGAGNGVNRFYSPLPTGGALGDYGNAYLSTNRVDITPRDGLLLLFPSYIMHSALAYRGERDRVVISFNSRSSLA